MSNSYRSRVREDRFYCPPAMRKHNQQQQQQQQQRKQAKQEEQLSMSINANDVTTNLDRFIKHTTPSVPAQHFPKTSIKRSIRNQEHGYNPYFILGDLWESLKEWSAYGAGVPLVLNETDSVVQYYVPYLSAIQLYVDPSTPVTKIKSLGDDSDCDSDSSRATSSDGGYEPRVEENNVGLINKYFNKPKSKAGDCLVDNGTELIFQYFEGALPYHRAPIADKISDLASKFPELKTCRSCDLTQSSWVSIAWYPIYRIPVGPSLKNLDASFLTFHSLSTPLTGRDGDAPRHHGSSVVKVDDVGIPYQLTLPIFGLAVYKFNNSDWTQSEVHGAEKVNSLMNSTENWLRSLNVYHPDFVFFKNRDGQ